MLCLTQASDLEPSSGTLTELKPVKQSVTYDNQTGKVMMMMIMMTMMIMIMMKVYAELGTSSVSARAPAPLGNVSIIIRATVCLSVGSF